MSATTTITRPNPGAPRALVLAGYGLNCDWETAYALDLAGARAERVHINHLIMGEGTGGRGKVEDYQFLAFAEGSRGATTTASESFSPPGSPATSGRSS